MAGIVSYRLEDSIATISMDDGKVNVLSPDMLGEIGEALDRAERAEAVVVLAGREGVFSGGFDLATLRAGGAEAGRMVRGGFELAKRILAFPRPVLLVCSGHAVAMGTFLLLSGDYRIGVEGPYRITANEVAIGMTLPRAAIEICRYRLTPALFNRALLLAEVFAPPEAVTAGFLDRVVPASAVDDAVVEVSTHIVSLDARAHAASKLRARGELLETLGRLIESDDVGLRSML
jgi:enoyl-CoA hydratase